MASVLLIAALGLILIARPAAAEQDNASSAIAFIRSLGSVPGLGSVNSLFTIAPDGSNEVRLTSPETNNIQIVLDFSWSPDGDRIAMSASETFGTPGASTSIYVINSDGTGLRRLTSDTNAADRVPEWSPDGSRIAYRSRIGQGTSTIRLVNADGSGVSEQLTTGTASGGGDDYISWSPDSTRLAFQRIAVPGTADIYVVDVADGSLEQITSDPAHDFYPDWSPDGSRIAFESWRDPALGLYTRNVTTGELVRVTTSGSNSFPSWSPTGAYISFLRFVHGPSPSEHRRDIIAVSPDGLELRVLAVGADQSTNVGSWRPDGQGVTYSSQGDIYVSDFAGNMLNLTSSGQIEFLPKWQPGQVVPNDSDGDGVPDPDDDCPGTAEGLPVDLSGCFQDLSVLFDSTATPSEVRAEDQADFVVDLSNLGQAGQEDVVLEISLPDGFTVSEGPDYAVYELDGTPVRQGACPVVGLSSTCSIGTIGTDEGASAAWKVSAPFLGADTVLTTRAQVTSASDLVSGNDTDALDVTVLATPRNLLYMAVGDSYAAGDDISPDFDDERRNQNKALSYPNRFLSYLLGDDQSWNPDGCRGDMTVPRNFNLSHSADTVDDFVDHGHRDAALDCSPDLVTVSLGANDVLGIGAVRKARVCLALISPFRSSEETAAAVIEEAVEPFLAIGAQVIVVGYPDPGACPVLQLYAFALQRQIEALNNPSVAFVDVDAAFVFHHTEIVISEEDASNPCNYMAPAGPGAFESLVGAHPNAIGHDVIASAVAEAATGGFLDWADSRPFGSCLEPSSGISGSEVIIHGADFREGASVFFGDISAAAVTVVDPYHVVATVPTGNELGTLVEVTVENTDGALAVVDQAFQYRSLPDLEPFWPVITRVGTNVTATIEVTNAGTADAGPFGVGVWSSRDTVVGPGDLFLGVVSFDAVSAGSTVEDDVPCGRRCRTGTFLIAVADSAFIIDELDESNNVAIIGVP